MLETNCEFLRQEIMDVIRLFSKEGADFAHAFSAEGEECINTVECGGKMRVFRDAFIAEGELEYKRQARRSAKLAFYNFLKDMTGKSFPWGALTGIRPTKLAYGELEGGRDFAPLFKKFGVSGQNISLVRRVIAAQREIYNSNRGSGADIFVSVPFCPTKCEYCSFITAPMSAVGKYADEYVSSLVREIESLKNFCRKINSVYIGGGTPFCLSAGQLTRIYAAINKLDIGGCEFTVEAGRPDTFTEEKLKLSLDMGVNRLCVNPQSFSDKTLVAIGRKHTAADTLRAYESAAKYGFSLNVDLIAGLAGEGMDEFKNSVDTAAKLSPDNITVHTLCLKAGSRLKESVSRLEDGNIGGMTAYSRDALTAAGYEPYYLYRQKYQAGANENVGWTKPGKACVYNVDVMEEICSNVAVGANAISKRVYPAGRIERLASPKDIPTYLNKCDGIIAGRERLFI